MAFTELDSFLSKFKHLQFAGIEATLTIESKNGEAFVTLKAGLGYLQPPHGFPPPRGYYDRQHRVHRGPAYFRRQERRKAARVEAAEQDDTNSQAEEVREVGVSEENVLQEVNNVAEKAAEEVCEDAEKEAEKVSLKQFECCVCDFVSNWENGLRVHMARKHSKIEQVDGVTDSQDDAIDENYDGSKHYWAKGYLGAAYQSFLDANATIDDCDDIPEEEKETVKLKVLEARKSALGKNFQDFPPWSTR